MGPRPGQRPRGPASPLSDALAIGEAYEQRLQPEARRKAGAHYTPYAVARRLAAIAISSPDQVVADPACGGGAFLLAAGEVLASLGADRAHVAREQLVGADADPGAVAAAREALEAWGGASNVVVRDALKPGWCAPDVVVGNPPFLSPLGATTVHGRGGGAYTDAAGLFLLAALDLVRDGGRVVMIQPESVLAARDAAVVRDGAMAVAALEGLWVAGERVFGASVRVCAPVLRRGGAQPARVKRWVGADVRRSKAAPFASNWATLRPNVPSVRMKTKGALGDIASATAGFRDEFYGLAAAAREDDGVPLVTSGLVDPARILWGSRTTKLAKRAFARPTVRLADLDARLHAWVSARLVPKVLLATQTRVLEAAVDADGRYVPVTPVISITGSDPWAIAAVLTSPAATAWALREYGGTALHGDAVKLSAAQVRLVPLPADLDAWSAGAAALRRGDVAACGAAMTTAYGTFPALLDWWTSRLPPNRV